MVFIILVKSKWGVKNMTEKEKMLAGELFITPLMNNW